MLHTPSFGRTITIAGLMAAGVNDDAYCNDGSMVMSYESITMKRTAVWKAGESGDRLTGLNLDKR
jgi:hypothetical protein